MDSVSILKLLSFHLSWNWVQDLYREVLLEAGLGDLVDELFPFNAEFSHKMVTVIDAEDIKGTQFWSDETLVQQYNRIKSPVPSFDSKEPIKRGSKTTASQDMERVAKETLTLDDLNLPKLDKNMASNNWAIHGNHTKTGKPLMTGDPHLTNQLPSHWYLLKMEYNGLIIAGSSMPGNPGFMMGATKDMTWTSTASRTDITDLYKEKLNAEGTQYFVDG